MYLNDKIEIIHPYPRPDRKIRMRKDDPLLKCMQVNGIDTEWIEVVDDLGQPVLGVPPSG